MFTFASSHLSLSWRERFWALPARTPRRQPHRLVRARPVLPADAPALVLQRVLALHLCRAPDRPARRARLAERRDPAPALADPPAACERRVRVDDAALALALVRLGLAAPLAVAVDAPGELCDRRDDAALVLGAPRTLDDDGAPAPVIPVRSAPVALVVLRGARLARRAPREQVAPWVPA